MSSPLQPDFGSTRQSKPFVDTVSHLRDHLVEGTALSGGEHWQAPLRVTLVYVVAVVLSLS